MRANIRPVSKKGYRTNASNYRPVSLTSICSKVLHSNIFNHLDQHNVLCEVQHGFRRKHFCESLLIQTIHDIASAIDKRKQTDAIIMDFSKAFDKVAHSRLFLKISQYGIRGNTHMWISTFLKDRQQRVVMNGSHSWVHVDSGVPQGTVLGSLLFLLFINDVDITKDLKWNQHSTLRLQTEVWASHAVISFCSRKTKAIAFISFVRPYLEYSSAVWDS